MSLNTCKNHGLTNVSFKGFCHNFSYKITFLFLPFSVFFTVQTSFLRGEHDAYFRVRWKVLPLAALKLAFLAIWGQSSHISLIAQNLKLIDRTLREGSLMFYHKPIENFRKGAQLKSVFILIITINFAKTQIKDPAAPVA